MKNSKHLIRYQNRVILGVIVEHIWEYLDHIAFRAIVGSFDALTIFRKYDIHNTTASTFIISFQLFVAVPCDSPHESE